MSFVEIKEQPGVIAALKSALKKNCLSHALLFLGPVNSGQLEVARALGQSLFCEKPKASEPCGDCVQCRFMEKGSHPDFFILESSLDSGVIRVEDVRVMIAAANLRPFQAKAKVFVINPADALNDAAQNALLKTLEEPAPHTFFILLSGAPERLLPTIRSRSHSFHFLPVSGGQTLDEEKSKLLMDLLEFISGSDPTVPDLSALEREELIQILDAAIEAFHQALRLKAGISDTPGSGPQTFWIKNAGHRFSEEGMMDCVETLAEFKEKIVGYVNIKLALAVLWDALRRVAV